MFAIILFVEGITRARFLLVKTSRTLPVDVRVKILKQHTGILFFNQITIQFLHRPRSQINTG